MKKQPALYQNPNAGCLKTKSVGRLKAVLRQQFGKVPVCAPFDLPQIGLRGFGLGELAVFGEVYVILLRLAFVCAGFYSEKI